MNRKKTIAALLLVALVILAAVALSSCPLPCGPSDLNNKYETKQAPNGQILRILKSCAEGSLRSNVETVKYIFIIQGTLAAGSADITQSSDEKLSFTPRSPATRGFIARQSTPTKSITEHGEIRASDNTMQKQHHYLNDRYIDDLATMIMEYTPTFSAGTTESAIDVITKYYGTKKACS